MLAGVGSSAIKRLERKFRRLRLNDFQLDLRGALTLGMPCAASRPLSKPGRPLCVATSSVMHGVTPGWKVPRFTAQKMQGRA